MGVELDSGVEPEFNYSINITGIVDGAGYFDISMLEFQLYYFQLRTKDYLPSQKPARLPFPSKNLFAPASGLVLPPEPLLRMKVPECDITAARRQFDTLICQRSRVSEQAAWARAESAYSCTLQRKCLTLLKQTDTFQVSLIDNQSRQVLCLGLCSSFTHRTVY